MFPVKWALDIRGAEQHQEDWNPFKIHPADWSFCLLVKQLDPVNSAFSFYHHTFISVTQSSRTTMFPPLFLVLFGVCSHQQLVMWVDRWGRNHNQKCCLEKISSIWEWWRQSPGWPRPGTLNKQEETNSSKTDESVFSREGARRSRMMECSVEFKQKLHYRSAPEVGSTNNQ